MPKLGFSPAQLLYIKEIVAGALPHDAIKTAGYSKTGGAEAVKRLQNNTLVQDEIENQLESVRLLNSYDLEGCLAFANEIRQKCLISNDYKTALAANKDIATLKGYIGIGRTQLPAQNTLSDELIKRLTKTTFKLPPVTTNKIKEDAPYIIDVTNKGDGVAEGEVN